jgi:hypothetical protein
MALFSLLIDKQGEGFGGGHPRGERQQLQMLLQHVIERLGDGVSVKADILGPNDPTAVIGTWEYTPVATDAVAEVAPTITSLEPAGCTIGTPDFTLFVHGTGFSAGSVIHFAGHDEPSTYSDVDGSLSTGVKPSLWLAPAVVQCTVRNGTMESNAVAFEFAATPAPQSAKSKT